MASTSEIRRRIGGVRQTQKITHAMYLISQAKLRKAKQDLDNTRPYFQALQTEIGRVFNADSTIESRYVDPVDPNAKPLPGVPACLLITADKGLAGAYNQNAIRQAQQNASPTCTKPREDPSYGDTVRTANQRAYAEDAKRFKGI